MHARNSLLTSPLSTRRRAVLAVARRLRIAQYFIRRSGIVDRFRPYAHWFGIAVAVAVVAGSFAVLINQLDGIDLAQVGAALRDHSAVRLVLAAIFITCAYTTLTFYDWFALKTIGAAHVPYRVAAMASFTSYSIGHNVGATAFSGGAIRYRIYSHHSLTVVDVAKICFVTGLTFWLGNLTVLGVGLIYAPEAAGSIDQLPAGLNRVIGIAALCVLAGYVAWVSCGSRRIGRDDWTLVLPGRASTLLQVGIGILDLTFCSLAMYMLMPDTPHYGFATVAVIFVTATLLGFASHSPGSLGVFDAAMVFAFAAVDKEDLVATLLLFRLMYFVVPFTLALTIMASRELMLMVRRRKVSLRDETSSNLHA